jgi:hypothetical protein
LPVVIDLNVGESVPFILSDASRRTVTLKETNLVFQSQGVTVWATATVEVSGPGLNAQSAVIPAAYLQAPVFLNGVRIYVAITKEFDSSPLREGDATHKAARLFLSDARYTMTAVSQYQWPFPNLLWQEGSHAVYSQGLQREDGRLYHYGGVGIGMPRHSAVHAWTSGVFRARDRGFDRIMWLEGTPDGSFTGGQQFLHLQEANTQLSGKSVIPGDFLGWSMGAVTMRGDVGWWHININGGYQWGPMLAEWYTAHASQKALSYIKDWLVAGPYNNPFDAFRLSQDYLGNEGAVEPLEGNPAAQGVAWKRWDNIVPGVISVGDAVDPYPNSGWAWVNGNYSAGAAYLATYVYSPESRAAVINLGSSDAVKVWLGSREVFSTNEFIPGKPSGETLTIIVDAHKVPIQLNAGWNRLLVKVAQRDGSPASWQLSVRISDGQGEPIPDLRVSPAKDLNAPTMLLAGSSTNSSAFVTEPRPMPTFVPEPTPTPTLEPPPTPTPTFPPTTTPAPTATPVPTPTPFPFPTLIPIPTPTPTTPPTATPTPAPTPTPVPTATPAPTATSTPTPTPTPSSTPPPFSQCIDASTGRPC